jgi:phosphoserine phosphatase
MSVRDWSSDVCSSDLLRAAQAGVDPADCWAYSDSIADLPFLEWAGTPVAVCPDPKLAAIAVQRGWEVIAHQTLSRAGRS